jgi:hypothetical protein
MRRRRHGRPAEDRVIYMVDMALAEPDRLAEWHAWYLGHIKVLLTVPGFRASQRFEAVVETQSPYLALHEVVSPALFASPAYRERGGPGATGEWQARMTNWHRNLLNGLDETPEVPPDKYLLVLADARDLALPDGISVEWLRAVGLDRSLDECGLAVLSDPVPALDLARRDPRARLYRPITAKLRG